jgi:hypothetical protein
MDDDIRVACPQACNLDRCVAEFSRFLPVSFLSATTLALQLLGQLTGEVSPQPFVLSFLVEHFIVLEGRLHIANGDKTLDAPAGKAVTVRKGVPRLVQSLGHSCPNAARFFTWAHRTTV